VRFKITSITASFAKGSEIGHLAPIIEVSKGASVSPNSGDVQDFSSDKTVTYTVTAEDGVSTKIYTAKATVVPN
jgi:hypothetical protein